MKFLLALFMILSGSAFAEYCDIQMVDSYNRTVRTYQGYDYSNLCRDYLRDCNRDLRTNNPGNRGVRCVKGNTSYPPTNPGYPPYPPTNPPYGQYNYLLNMSNVTVADYARRGQVGSCYVETGSIYSQCEYYVKVNGMSYPSSFGSGCTKVQYTQTYGCYSGSQKDNAGCIIKRAIRENRCR